MVEIDLLSRMRIHFRTYVRRPTIGSLFVVVSLHPTLELRPYLLRSSQRCDFTRMHKLRPQNIRAEKR